MRVKIKISLFWFLVAIIAVLALAGCERAEPQTFLSTEDRSVYGSPKHLGSPQEICYDGVVYVNFNGGGNAAWGGVKLDQSGKVVTCRRTGIGAAK